MSVVSYKATAIAQSMLSDLNFRGPLVFTLAQDTDGYPYLTTGSGSPGAQNIIIKVINYLDAQNNAAVTAVAPLPYLDELQLRAAPFSPTQILVSVEASATANVTLVLAKNLAPALMEAALRGADVQLLLTANGVAPTPGAGTLQTDFSNSFQYGLPADN